MTTRAWPIARIYGIEIRIHFSWIPVLALITVGTGIELGSAAPSMPETLRWVAGGLLGLLFLASIIVHELAHSIVARRRGLTVYPITIVFFGGMSSLEQEARRASDEAAIALAGPLVSLGVGAVLIALAYAIGESAQVLSLGCAAVASVNLLLGAINLVPALPLDGGRVVRAIVWQATGDARRGARVAGMVGRMIGATGIGVGLVISLLGDGTTGAITLVGGWFLVQGSRVMERRAQIEALISGLHVGEVMERDVPTIAPNLTVDAFAQQFLEESEATSLPVLSGKALLGLVGVSQLRRIARKKWVDLRAEDVMTARPGLPSLAAGDELWSGLELLRRTGLDGLPVMAGSDFLGILTRRAVAAAIQSRATAQAAAPPR